MSVTNYKSEKAFDKLEQSKRSSSRHEEHTKFSLKI